MGRKKSIACKKGHLLIGENIMIHGKSRRCRICHREQAKKTYYRSKKRRPKSS